MNEVPDRTRPAAPIRAITRLVGERLRAELANPEADPLPAEHVDLLLQLRHKERSRVRR